MQSQAGSSFDEASRALRAEPLMIGHSSPGIHIQQEFHELPFQRVQGVLGHQLGQSYSRNTTIAGTPT